MQRNLDRLRHEELGVDEAFHYCARDGYRFRMWIPTFAEPAKTVLID